jgi:hypothetical protein
MQEVSWVCLALMFVLCVMPSAVGGLSTLDWQWLSLEEAAAGDLPELLDSVVRSISGPGSSLLRSLHLPDLPFHPPA